MANRYVRSGAAGAADGTSWADAYTTIAAAVTASSAGDRIWVADDHSFTANAAISWTCPTAFPGIQILGVDTHTVEPPTGLVSSPTAVEAVGATGASFGVTGEVYMYGIILTGGTNNSSANSVLLNNATGNVRQTYENCKFVLATTNSGTNIRIGVAGSSSSVSHRMVVRNCEFQFANVQQGIQIGTANTELSDITVNGSATTPTTLFKGLNAAHGIADIIDCDLSSPASTNLVVPSTSQTQLTFRNCEIPASINILSAAIAGEGFIVRVHNCDSGDTRTRIATHTVRGSIVTQTSTRVRTGGATDAEGTLFSWLMTGATDTSVTHSLVSDEIAIWNDTVGSAVTATIEILRDNATNLQNDEIWMEASYLGTSGVPLGTGVSDRVASVMATAADQDASSVTWDTTGMTNPNKQKLSVTFTPQEVGYIIAKVKLGTNTSVYVDPVITLS